jgi:aquaporin Z
MIKALASECLGTLALIFVILTTGNYLAIGAILALGVFVGGPISGGNFNPAVTMVMVLANKQKVGTAMPYIAAQLLGALAGLELFRMKLL